MKDFEEIRITGYFSETIRDTLQRVAKIRNHKIQLISPEFKIRSTRDNRNLQALGKLAEVGVEIKFNNRLHARFLVSHIPAIEQEGLLIIGSFDFNTECIGLERYDAGVITKHPDLVKSAIELFDQIWNEPESISLEEFIQK